MAADQLGQREGVMPKAHNKPSLKPSEQKINVVCSTVKCNPLASCGLSSAVHDAPHYTNLSWAYTLSFLSRCPSSPLPRVSRDHVSNFPVAHF